MVKDNCLYTTLLKKNIRSDNSYAQLEDGTFVHLLKVIVDFTKSEETTICCILKTENHNLCNNFKYLHKVKEVENIASIIPTSIIKNVCINIESNQNQYICPIVSCFYY